MENIELIKKHLGFLTPDFVIKNCESLIDEVIKRNLLRNLTQVNDVKYYFCSPKVIECFPYINKSLPFKSGYSNDIEDNYYVVSITDDQYSAIEWYFENQLEGDKDFFWMFECCDSLVEDQDHRFKVIDHRKVFLFIENNYSLTKLDNIAYVIYKLSENVGKTPIEFINDLGGREEQFLIEQLNEINLKNNIPIKLFNEPHYFLIESDDDIYDLLEEDYCKMFAHGKDIVYKSLDYPSLLSGKNLIKEWKS